MRIGNLTRTAVDCLSEIAAMDGETVPLWSLAKQFDVSQSHLEDIFQRLSAANLVRGQRGPTGGYVLARDPNDITLAEICHAAEVIGAGDFDRHSSAWVRASDMLGEAMDGITLATLTRPRAEWRRAA